MESSRDSAIPQWLSVFFLVSAAGLAAILVAQKTGIDRSSNPKPVEVSGASRTTVPIYSTGLSKSPDSDRQFFQKGEEGIDTIADSAGRGEAIRKLATEWTASNHIGSALDWALTLSRREDRGAAIAAIIDSAEDKLDAAIGIQSRGIDLGQFTEAAEGFPNRFFVEFSRQQGHDRVFEWIDQNLTGLEKATQIAVVTGDLVNLDPALAIERLEEMPSGKARDLAVYIIVKNWSHIDPRAVAPFVESLPHGRLKDRAVRRLASNWVTLHHEGLSADLNSLKESDYKTKLITEVSLRLADSKPVEALGWANETEEPLKTAIVKKVMGRWSQHSPEAAAQYLLEVGDPDQFGELSGVVLPVFARSKPMEAGDWVLNLPEGKHKSILAGQLVSVWASMEPEESSVWVNHLETGEIRDVAVSALVQSIAKEDPDSAFQWAKTIESVEIRDAVIGLLDERQN